MSKNNTPAITVKAKRQEGFWRAGFHFTREPREFAAGELTEAQHKAISQEPHLIVIETGESEADRIKREKAEAAAAEKARREAEAKEKAAAAAVEKANKDALAREKTATKKPEGKAAWDVAEQEARAGAQLDETSWAALPASDRVERIEAKLAEAAK